jgi:hypothetical protein
MHQRSPGANGAGMSQKTLRSLPGSRSAPSRRRAASRDDDVCAIRIPLATGHARNRRAIPRSPCRRLQAGHERREMTKARKNRILCPLVIYMPQFRNRMTCAPMSHSRPALPWLEVGAGCEHIAAMAGGKSAARTRWAPRGSLGAAAGTSAARHCPAGAQLGRDGPAADRRDAAAVGWREIGASA